MDLDDVGVQFIPPSIHTERAEAQREKSVAWGDSFAQEPPIAPIALPVAGQPSDTGSNPGPGPASVSHPNTGQAPAIPVATKPKPQQKPQPKGLFNSDLDGALAAARKDLEIKAKVLRHFTAALDAAFNKCKGDEKERTFALSLRGTISVAIGAELGVVAPKKAQP